MNRKNFDAILVFLFLCSWINFPKYFYEKYQVDLPGDIHGQNLLPYFLPVLLACGFYVCFQRPIRLVWPQYFLKSSLGWAALIVFYVAVLDIFYVYFESGDYYPRMTLPILWMFIFFFTGIKLVERIKVKDPYCYFVRASCYAAVAIALLQLFSFIGWTPGLREMYEGRVTEVLLSGGRLAVFHENMSSYVCCLGIFVLLFFPEHKISKKWQTVIFILFTVVIFLNQTRGAMMLIFALCFVRFFVFKRRDFIYSFSLIFYSAVGFYIIFQYFGGDHRVFDLDDSSAIERIELFYFSVDNFLRNPVFGIGAHSESVQTLEGHNVHIYYLRLLVAYGLIGFLLFSRSYFSLYRSTNIGKAVLCCAFVFYVASFETYLYWYYSILPFLAQLQRANGCSTLTAN